MFAGDVGTSWAAGLTYDNVDQFTFITSGMCGNPEENFIISHVLSDGSIKFEVICLSTDDVNCFNDISQLDRADTSFI